MRSEAIDEQQAQVDQNYEAFKQQLHELMKSDPGRTALMQNGEVIACFDTDRDAYVSGSRLLNGPFSLQEIRETPIDLGYYSHVYSIR